MSFHLFSEFHLSQYLVIFRLQCKNHKGKGATQFILTNLHAVHSIYHFMYYLSALIKKLGDTATFIIQLGSYFRVTIQFMRN